MVKLVWVSVLIVFFCILILNEQRSIHDKYSISVNESNWNFETLKTKALVCIDFGMSRLFVCFDVELVSVVFMEFGV